MELNRKQIKSLLDVMSSDTSRPVLTEANINIAEGNLYLTATDGYQLVALLLDDSLKELEGKAITRADMTKWYKLATAKDIFNNDTVKELATESAGNYPDWYKIIDREQEAIPEITINATYMLTMQIIADKPLPWMFHGKLGPAVARWNDDIYVVMPLKS